LGFWGGGTSTDCRLAWLVKSHRNANAAVAAFQFPAGHFPNPKKTQKYTQEEAGKTPPENGFSR